VYNLFENITFCYESISLRWAKGNERTLQFAVLNGVSLHPKGSVREITVIVVCGHERLELRVTRISGSGIR